MADVLQELFSRIDFRRKLSIVGKDTAAPELGYLGTKKNRENREIEKFRNNLPKVGSELAVNY